MSIFTPWCDDTGVASVVSKLMFPLWSNVFTAPSSSYNRSHCLCETSPLLSPSPRNPPLHLYATSSQPLRRPVPRAADLVRHHRTHSIVPYPTSPPWSPHLLPRSVSNTPPQCDVAALAPSFCTEHATLVRCHHTLFVVSYLTPSPCCDVATTFSRLVTHCPVLV